MYSNSLFGFMVHGAGPRRADENFAKRLMQPGFSAPAINTTRPTVQLLNSFQDKDDERNRQQRIQY